LPSRSRISPQQTDAEWPGLQPPVVLPDSLTPPLTATEPDLPRVLTPRSSTVWLLSGVIAALVVLGVGVGLKHWRDRGHAAVSASPPGVPRPAPAAEPQPAAPAPVEPPVVPPSAPEAVAPVPPAAGRGAAAAPAAHAAPAPPAAKPALRPKSLKPPASEAVETTTTPDVAPKRPAPRKVVGLPDNPY
jgi:hypothetical protein